MHRRDARVKTVVSGVERRLTYHNIGVGDHGDVAESLD
jgi:hypothetical protein